MVMKNGNGKAAANGAAAPKDDPLRHIHEEVH